VQENMTPELQQKLYEKYPIIFREKDLPVSKSCMRFGLCIGDGWYTLVDNFCNTLEALKELGWQTIALQVKQKMGTFTFYFTAEAIEGKIQKVSFKEFVDIVYNILCGYVKLSSSTCEMCGCPGKPTTSISGWRSVKCENCDV